MISIEFNTQFFQHRIIPFLVFDRVHMKNLGVRVHRVQVVAKDPAHVVRLIPKPCFFAQLTTLDRGHLKVLVAGVNNQTLSFVASKHKYFRLTYLHTSKCIGAHKVRVVNFE